MRDTTRPTLLVQGEAVVDAAGGGDAGSNQARVRLVGKLSRTPELTPIPYKHDVQTTAKVMLRQNQFEVEATGEAARALNAAGQGAVVDIRGHVVDHRWTTADDKEHSRIAIVADEVKRVED